MSLLKLGALSIGALAAALAAADITYVVKNGSANDRLQIEIMFEARDGVNALEIPNWAPGAYRLVNHFQRVTNLNLSVDSNPVKPTVEKNRVEFPARAGQSVKVTYEVPTQFANGIGHFSGPSTYYYVVNRIQEKCILRFEFSAPTPIAVGLDAVTENKIYTAPDYDVLADNPVSYGDFIRDTYLQGGKLHEIVYRGVGRFDIDRDRVRRGCREITRMQGDFFSGLPYTKYVWHFSVNDSIDGAGGLEHLSSTQISLASGFGPRAYSVCSHEFFHLWNVKRIRSKVLGPFNYNELPQTGALWWLEGVTDYYAHTLLPRYGIWRKQALYEDLVENLRSVRSRQARFQISPYDSSYRVREAAGGLGNSQGLLVSYYDTGWLLGFVLDVEILAQSGGKRSLDDVELELWRLCKDGQPGFEEDKIRELCVKYGGPNLGAFFDQVVMQPGEIPVEAALEKLGLQIEKGTEPYARTGVSARSNIERGGMLVTASDTPLISIGELIVAVKDRPTTGKTNRQITTAYNQALGELKTGQKVVMTVADATGNKREVTLICKSETRPYVRVVERLPVTPAQRALRQKFEARKRSGS